MQREYVMAVGYAILGVLLIADTIPLWFAAIWAAVFMLAESFYYAREKVRGDA